MNTRLVSAFYESESQTYLPEGVAPFASLSSKEKTAVRNLWATMRPFEAAAEDLYDTLRVIEKEPENACYLAREVMKRWGGLIEGKATEG
jgi:hypothetical protein